MTTRLGTEIWKCLDCPHCLYDKELLVGRIARCYHCDSPFKIDILILEKAKLRCDDCAGKTREDIKEEGTEELLNTKDALGRPTFDLKNLIKQVAEKNNDEDPSLEDQQNKVIRDLIRSGSEQEG